MKGAADNFRPWLKKNPLVISFQMIYKKNSSDKYKKSNQAFSEGL